MYQVSHPESAVYGQHWTAAMVAEMFAPSLTTVQAVKDWLYEAGVHPDGIQVSRSRGWLDFNATVGEVERLLQTEYHVYSHPSGMQHLACNSYSLPQHVSPHIDIITPTIHFDTKVGSGTHRRQFEHVPVYDKDLVQRQNSPPAPDPPNKLKGILGSADDGSNPKQGAAVNNVLMTLDNCDTMITPTCLRALYDMPPGSKANASNSLGVVEYTPQAFLQSDLDMWFKQFSPGQVGQTPQTQLIDGAVVQQTQKSFDFNGESSLDLQYAMALVSPQTVTLYQVGDLIAQASFNNFLDALDASYCTFEGGDSKDPAVDGQYPDTQKGGFNGPEACGSLKATNVISTSYGSNEADLSAKYVQRQCAEYMKLGLQGVSVLYSSGDFGVAGNGNTCINPVTGAYNNGSSGIFNPSFPGGCPWVTSVGATQINPGSTVHSPEGAAEQVIFSGGGFSNVFAMPSYQQKAISTYYEQSAPPYGADRYNNSQKVRGFPDVAANGVNYVIAVDGNFSRIFGTSASCPTFASLISNVNEERLAVGKAPVGFLNNVLYANAGIMNDVTDGGNKGCGTAGFQAVKGWDPVTGLGTPNYPNMLKLFMSLP